MSLSWRRIRWSALRLGTTVTVIMVTVGVVMRQPAWSKHPPSPATVDPARLEAHVRFLSVDCFPRHSGARANQQKAIEYISAHFRAAGGRVELQPFSTPSGIFQNVIARFGPDTGPRYVIGAHFDSCGVQPGADDNASGVAGLLELATLLGRDPAPGVGFELVAYNLEEPPFFAGPYMGSAVHARELRAAQVPVKLMLSLEMIGCFSDEPGSQSYPSALIGLFYPSRANFIAIVGRWQDRSIVGAFKRACAGTAEIPIASIAAPSFVPAIDFSDHRNY